MITLRKMASLAAAAALTAPLIASAQSAKPQLTSVAHVALRVTDMQAEVDFLAKVGFEVGFDHKRDGVRNFVFVKVNDGEFFEVIPNGPQSRQPLGFSHVCFVTNDAKAIHDQWVAAGLDASPVTNGPDDTLEFGVKTPAGNGAVTEALQIVPNSQPAEDMGQHLGAHRISTWLRGVDMPVDDVPTWQAFYEKFGLIAKKQGNAVSMTWPTKSDIEIILRPKDANTQLKILLDVNDVKKAADQLRAAGLTVDMSNNQALVHDPDGNIFAFQKF